MITRYCFESLAPTWLAGDTSYRSALGDFLTSCMDERGYRIAVPPAVQAVTDGTRTPVGTVLLRAECGVEEFDLDMGDPPGE